MYACAALERRSNGWVDMHLAKTLPSPVSSLRACLCAPSHNATSSFHPPGAAAFHRPPAASQQSEVETCRACEDEWQHHIISLRSLVTLAERSFAQLRRPFSVVARYISPPPL